VDVVERVGLLGPVVFVCVVDFEFEVGRHPGWLHGGDVGADYFGVGVGVCEVAGGRGLGGVCKGGWMGNLHCPDACSGADVEGFLDGIADGG